MASTNKTTHYNLSQYVGSDKPTYLVDYNTDMSNIDTGIYNAQGKADTNETAIGNLSNLDTTAKTDLVSAINEVKGTADTSNTNIGNLSNLTTTANSNLVVAINEVDAEADANTSNIGTLANLETTNKSNLVGAINEVNTNVGTNASNISNLQTALNGVKGTILWTNANPSNNFNAQTISVPNMGDYDEIKVIYKYSTTSNGQKVSDNFKDALTIGDELEYIDGADTYVRDYTLKFSSNEITFGQSSIPGVAYHNETNIPLYVIGYKTGLFN